MAAGFVPMSDAITRWLLFVPQELIDDTVCFNAYLAEVYRTTIGRIPGYPAERRRFARLRAGPGHHGETGPERARAGRGAQSHAGIRGSTATRLPVRRCLRRESARLPLRVVLPGWERTVNGEQPPTITIINTNTQVIRGHRRGVHGGGQTRASPS